MSAELRLDGGASHAERPGERMALAQPIAVTCRDEAGARRGRSRVPAMGSMSRETAGSVVIKEL